MEGGGVVRRAGRGGGGGGGSGRGMTGRWMIGRGLLVARMVGRWNCWLQELLVAGLLVAGKFVAEGCTLFLGFFF